MSFCLRLTIPETNSKRLYVCKRAQLTSTFVSLIDTQPQLLKDNFSQEITSYEKSDWSSSNLDLLKRHGALLFFKENHMQYPILSEIVKAIFSIQPTSTAIESV